MFQEQLANLACMYLRRLREDPKFDPPLSVAQRINTLINLLELQYQDKDGNPGCGCADLKRPESTYINLDIGEPPSLSTALGMLTVSILQGCQVAAVYGKEKTSRLVLCTKRADWAHELVLALEADYQVEPTDSLVKIREQLASVSAFLEGAEIVVELVP